MTYRPLVDEDVTADVVELRRGVLTGRTLPPLVSVSPEPGSSLESRLGPFLTVPSHTDTLPARTLTRTGGLWKLAVGAWFGCLIGAQLGLYVVR